MNIIYQKDIENINNIRNSSDAVLFLTTINALFDEKKALPYESYKDVSLGVFLLDELLSEKFISFIVKDGVSDKSSTKIAKKISKEINVKTKYSKNIHSRVLVKNNIFLSNKDYFDKDFKFLVKQIKNLNFNIVKDLSLTFEEGVNQEEFYNIFDFLVLFRDEEEFSLNEMLSNFKDNRKKIMVEGLSNLYLDLIKDNLFIFNQEDQKMMLPLLAQFDDRYNSELAFLFNQVADSECFLNYSDYIFLSGNEKATGDFFTSRKEDFSLTTKIKLKVNFEKGIGFSSANKDYWIKDLETLFRQDNDASNFTLGLKSDFYASHHSEFFEKFFNIDLDKYDCNFDNIQEINKNFHKLLLPLIPVMLYDQAKNSLEFKDFKDKKIKYFKTLEKCLDDNGIDYINVVNCDNENILHHLIKMKGFSKIKELDDIILSMIEKGCNVNQQNNEGCTPLMYIPSVSVDLFNKIIQVLPGNSKIDYFVENNNEKSLLTIFNRNSKINKTINRTYQKMKLMEDVDINNKKIKKKVL